MMMRGLRRKRVTGLTNKNTRSSHGARFARQIPGSNTRVVAPKVWLILLYYKELSISQKPEMLFSRYHIKVY